MNLNENSEITYERIFTNIAENISGETPQRFVVITTK